MYKDILQRYPGSAPVVRDVGWHKGELKLVACTDDRAVKFYEETITEAGELWPEADLVAVEIPSRQRSWAWVPAEPSDPKDIRELIQLDNVELQRFVSFVILNT